MSTRLVPASDGQSIQLDKPVLLIGRNPDCDIILKCSKKVSRQHCLVAVANSRVIVRDLASTNGVWINGHRVEREGRVRIGDELAIADVLYYLINEEKSERNTSRRGQPSEGKSRETLDESNIREARVSADSLYPDLESDLAALEPGVEVPVPIPEEEDSFAVEVSMPRLPRVKLEDLRNDRKESPEFSGDSRHPTRNSVASRGDPDSNPGMRFRAADEDSDDIIPLAPRDV